MNHMSRLPTPLIPNDVIEIIAPAKAIEAEHVHYAKAKLIEYGYHVLISPNCLGQHHYFSGTEEVRLSDLQNALDNPQSRAILCARGGYGCVQLVDRLDWTKFMEHPKWLIGFSDITVLHQRLHRMGIPSIHGTMPLNFKENTNEALITLIDAFCGRPYQIASNANKYNLPGQASGKLIGGNLAILYSLLGTDDQPDYQDAILFVEEVGEPLYSIDRMFYSLKKAGILHKIKGLVVGGMTSMKDSEIPFGKTLEEIILSHTEVLRIPVCFDFPAGHIKDNRALVLGTAINLHVTKNGAELHFSEVKAN